MLENLMKMQTMSFVVKDKQLLKNHTKIWEKFKN